jgi:hypothetical protein
MREACSRRPAKRQADDAQSLDRPKGASGIGVNGVGKWLGEHASPATSIGAEELAYTQVPAHDENAMFSGLSLYVFGLLHLGFPKNLPAGEIPSRAQTTP